MWRSVERLQSFRVLAEQRELGTVEEIELDDERWLIRYLVVRGSDWPLSDRVRIPPHAVCSLEWEAGTLTLESTREIDETDSRLRGSGELIGCHVQAPDEPVGQVEDLLFDEQTWSIGALVVDTSSWCSGRRVLVPPRVIRDVSWAERTVLIDVARGSIESDPAYDAARAAAAGGQAAHATSH